MNANALRLASVAALATLALSACGATGWAEVSSGQAVVSCRDVQAGAPPMPTSIVPSCYDDEPAGGVVPWEPGA